MRSRDTDMFKRIFMLLLFVLGFSTSEAQQDLSNYIYTILQGEPSDHQLCRINVETDEVESLAVMPIEYFVSNFSVSVNVVDNRFYFSNGYELFTFDAENGMLLSTIPYDISETAEIFFIQYNWCDGQVYAILNDWPTEAMMVSIDPLTGVATDIIDVFTAAGFASGEPAMLDPAEDLFIYRTGSHVIGRNIYTGEIIFDTPPINISGEIFGHMSYDCEKEMIIGTSANLNEEVKYLAQMDPYEGVVEHIGTESWEMGFWKPYGGGNTINQAEGTYYYSGVESLIVGAETSTGNLAYDHFFGLEEFFHITHFSACDCVVTDVIDHQGDGNMAYPNPTNGLIRIKSGDPIQSVQVFDAVGRKVEVSGVSRSRGFELDLSQHSEGIYFLRIEQNGAVQTQQIVKL
jgi:hypothetical protein